MKITHCISSIDESTGGPARSVTNLCEELIKYDRIKEVSLLTLSSIKPLVRDFQSSKGKIEFFLISLGISKQLDKRLSVINTDLFHGHGIWEQPVHQMAKKARKRNLPYIISVRGMLEPWSLTQGKFKKKIALMLFQHKDLQRANCLHATGKMELESIRALGFNNPIADIPNGIQTDQYPVKDFSKKRDLKKILFLSRIHPKKGIEILINSWEKLNPEIRENWIVEIAGNGEETYIQSLNKIVQSKNLQNQITIVGPVFGAEKVNSYQNADIFVLPTYSENFGIVIAEALSCGTPVITTKGTPWEELEKENAGRWIDIGEEPLKIALSELMMKTDFDRETMGKNGRKLIEEKYSIEAVAKKMEELYEWIIFKEKKPDFVYL
nr:glycosyltransferase [uncultured Flavobacterium sp.]